MNQPELTAPDLAQCLHVLRALTDGPEFAAPKVQEARVAWNTPFTTSTLFDHFERSCGVIHGQHRRARKTGQRAHSR